MKTICQLCYQIGLYQCDMPEQAEQAANNVIDACIQYLKEPCPKNAILVDFACIDYVAAVVWYGEDPYAEAPATKELYAAMSRVWGLHDSHDMAAAQSEPEIESLLISRRDKPMD